MVVIYEFPKHHNLCYRSKKTYDFIFINEKNFGKWKTPNGFLVFSTLTAHVPERSRLEFFRNALVPIELCCY